MGSGARSVDLPASQGQDDDARGCRHDGDVGDVAHEVAAVVDEVDDVAAQEAWFAQKAVDEVADRAAQDQAEGHRPGARRQVPGDTDDDGHDAGGDERENPRLPGSEGEGGARVAHQDQAKRPAEQLRVPTVGQG